MGANAQTTVPTFTASQVLTADQMNQSARTGIPVFASTVTRDAGFGGTGEKTLAEGQLCYVEGTGLQSYNGSAWVTWGTEPTSGLVVVKAETSFSASSSVTADGIFTSSYTNYRINIKYTTSTTGDLLWRLRVGGVSASGANYNWERIRGDGATASAARNAAETSVQIGKASNGAFNSTITLDVFDAQLATPTTYLWSNNYTVAAYNTPTYQSGAGNHDQSTAYDGLELLPASGTITGTYTVYAYGKSL
jgi:hypothetical protein